VPSFDFETLRIIKAVAHDDSPCEERSIALSLTHARDQHTMYVKHRRHCPNYVNQLRKSEAVLGWQSQSNIAAELAQNSSKNRIQK